MSAEAQIVIRCDRYGHGERDFTMTKTDTHCVQCGRATVWREEGSDDYYTGDSYYCTACRCCFSYQESDISMAGDQRFLDELVHKAAKVAG